jgi:hypothetical protein
MKFVNFKIWDGGRGWETAASHTEFGACTPPKQPKNASADRHLGGPSGDALSDKISGFCSFL